MKLSRGDLVQVWNRELSKPWKILKDFSNLTVLTKCKGGHWEGVIIDPLFQFYCEKYPGLVSSRFKISAYSLKLIQKNYWR